MNKDLFEEAPKPRRQPTELEQAQRLVTHLRSQNKELRAEVRRLRFIVDTHIDLLEA